ncbi:hypothetical protein [uncultured Bartonella sp.]|uniref:hypothetical protein n=1 Tax=uncultured Bartonella sp. TaxID=104108 RepID=UPI002618D0E3|nr:hypothetical protein [uncultured Bartonella sp.]
MAELTITKSGKDEVIPALKKNDRLHDKICNDIISNDKEPTRQQNAAAFRSHYPVGI